MGVRAGVRGTANVCRRARASRIAPGRDVHADRRTRRRPLQALDGCVPGHDSGDLSGSDPLSSPNCHVHQGALVAPVAAGEGPEGRIARDDDGRVRRLHASELDSQLRSRRPGAGARATRRMDFRGTGAGRAAVPKRAHSCHRSTTRRSHRCRLRSIAWQRDKARQSRSSRWARTGRLPAWAERHDSRKLTRHARVPRSPRGPVRTGQSSSSAWSAWP